MEIISRQIHGNQSCQTIASQNESHYSFNHTVRKPPVFVQNSGNRNAYLDGVNSEWTHAQVILIVQK